MSYLNVVMSLEDFILYAGNVFEENSVYLYVEKRVEDNSIDKVLFSESQLDVIISDYNYKNLNFFLSTKKITDTKKSFYDDDICQYVIEGVGGRVTSKAIERLALRLISKTPDSGIKKAFNSIKNKLKNDTAFGMGVKGNSLVHKNFYYQIDKVGRKLFLSDIYNDKAPIIEVI